MRAPPNLGLSYAYAFSAVYPRLAAKHGVPFDPFFLDGVAAVPELNQPDGIHPNARAQPLLLNNVWGQLTPLLRR